MVIADPGMRVIFGRRYPRLGGQFSTPIHTHGLRAGFVTTAYRNGVSDEEIMGHTRHQSLTTMRSYVRRAKLSQTSPAGKLGL
jgi:integrase